MEHPAALLWSWCAWWEFRGKNASTKAGEKDTVVTRFIINFKDTRSKIFASPLPPPAPLPLPPPPLTKPPKAPPYFVRLERLSGAMVGTRFTSWAYFFLSLCFFFHFFLSVRTRVRSGLLSLLCSPGHEYFVFFRFVSYLGVVSRATYSYRVALWVWDPIRVICGGGTGVSHIIGKILPFIFVVLVAKPAHGTERACGGGTLRPRKSCVSTVHPKGSRGGSIFDQGGCMGRGGGVREK